MEVTRSGFNLAYLYLKNILWAELLYMALKFYVPGYQSR